MKVQAIELRATFLGAWLRRPRAPQSDPPGSPAPSTPVACAVLWFPSNVACNSVTRTVKVSPNRCNSNNVFQCLKGLCGNCMRLLVNFRWRWRWRCGRGPGLGLPVYATRLVGGITTIEGLCRRVAGVSGVYGSKFPRLAVGAPDAVLKLQNTSAKNAENGVLWARWTTL